MKQLKYEGNQTENSIGVRLLQKAEKNIVIKSYMFKIKGMSSSDIAQELRIKIWNVRNKYKPNKSSMSTFVNWVVKNHLKNLFKASERKKHILNKAISFDNITLKDMKFIEER